MVPIKPGETLAPGNLQDKLLHHVPEISKLAEIEVLIVFNQDSTNFNSSHWKKIASIIHQNIEKFDGFVIIHGTDTMVFTAAALSFSLINLKKPVIMTGAQRPLAKLRSDARNNLIDAVELATLATPEVVIVFGQYILRGNRSKKISINSYDAFRSPNYPTLGHIGLNVNINNDLLLKPVRDYKFDNLFAADLASIYVHPESNPEAFESLFEHCRAIFLMGFGLGNLPVDFKSWVPFIKKATEREIIILVASNSPHGEVNLSMYDVAKKIETAGAIGIKDMTIEAALVKTMKILAVKPNRYEFIKRLYNNIAGEIKS